MNKKFLAKLLIFCMIFTMLPMTAFGAATDTDDKFTNNTGGVYEIEWDAATKQLTGVQAGNSVNVGATVTYSIGSDVTATAVEYTLVEPTTGVKVEGSTVTVANTVAKDTTFTVKASSTVGVTDDQRTIYVTKEFTVTAADEITFGTTPEAEVAATLPVEINPGREGTDRVYTTTKDTSVIAFNIKKDINAVDTSVTKVTVNMSKKTVEALKAALTGEKTAALVISDLGNIKLSKDVLDKITVTKDTDVVVFTVAKITNATTEANGITKDNVKDTFEVEFTLNGNPVLSKDTVDTNPAVILTVRTAIAAGTTAYAYYLDNNSYVSKGISGGTVKEDSTVDISAKHFSTIVLTDKATDDTPTTNPPGGSGGGSSSNVSIATKVTGGKVTVTPTRPTRGQTVTITVTPADGYKLESLKVTDLKGNEIELTKVSDNKYTFVMPAGKVTVTPVFTKIDGSDKDDNTTNVSKRFSDVATDAWYAEYINYVAENGLMNGYEDGRFGPNDQTTRAQIVTVLYRMEGEPAVQNASSFKDVSAGGQYYSSAVAWAARNNIVNGYEDGRFAPNDNVTREQIAAILYRYAAYKEYDTTLAGNIASFSDAARVSSWATDAIAWAVGEGLMNGDNGALRPQGNATRAEIAALLMRFAENIAK